MKHLLIIISGPSGVGKGTIVQELLKREGYALSVSCTTRAKRTGEEDGVSYFFLSREEFEKKIEENGFLEYSEHFDNYYGTPRDFVEEQLKTHDVILEIEVDGGLKAKEAHPEAILIMVIPPNTEELLSRLHHRGTESEETIAKRLKRMDYELSKRPLYNYVIVNDELERAVDEIEQIIKSNKNK